MSSLAESHTATDPSESAISLGSTPTSANAIALAQRPGQKEKWLELFHALPMELNINIMAQMELDPVSQVCLGLTNRYFYKVFHAVRDMFLYDGSRVYPIKSYQFDLRMQISTCEQHMWHGWAFPWKYLDDDSSIRWEKSLGELLRDERMWGDLLYCGGCAKYKKEEAFLTSKYEESITEKGIENWEETIEETWEGITQQCRRCRAKAILVHVEHRTEWFDDEIVEEDRTSLGLRKLDWEVYIMDGDPLRAKMTEKEFLEVVGGYETWSEVFENMGL
ncbi:hypothetical protein EG329_013527 [Mollisiaceae sp. DMI_Dod_QoI]|nr:hypothetical protein EG329_013527 [Helotiales sp. DMI_Dod_QoI]